MLMALFDILCFSTYVRPSSANTLRTVDLVPPPPGGGIAALMMWTLLVAPTERGIATETGDYDMAVVLDDSREPRLGEMLGQQQEAQLLDCEVSEEDDEGQVPMWNFGPKAYVHTGKRAFLGLGFEPVCQTPHQARHGGP